MTISSAAVVETPPVLNFGVEKEVEYTGHLTLAANLLPLPRRLFASTDDTHIRVWDSSGRDVAKTCFPGHRRAMVAAMAYCHSHSAIVTAEMDMTIKVYVAETLQLVESFSVEQARKRGQVKEVKGGSSGKVNALEMVSSLGQDWMLLGGDGGLELWSLQRTNSVRGTAVKLSTGRLEYHLRLEVVRRLSTSPILGIHSNVGEQRVTAWGAEMLCVYEADDMSLVASFQRPHGGEAVRCSCLQIISILDTALLTGGMDGKVNFWMIRSRQTLEEGSTSSFRKDATMALEYSLPGHNRPVEMVSFYARLEPNAPQRYCISFGRDGKLKVWSLSYFSLIYSLDVPLLDARSIVFSLGRHLFGVCSIQAASASGAAGGPKTTLTIGRFTAQIAAPFATTNASPVRHMAQAPQRPPDAQQGSLSDAVVLVSDDMAVHIVDAEARRVIATLPPPPNSQVQILRALLCPVWQLLILWLSTQEIAIFFVPRPTESDSGKAQTRLPTKQAAGGQLVATAGSRRATEAATPLLVRRFSIFEVSSGQVSSNFWKESFQCVTLHHGTSPPKSDQMAQRIFTSDDANAPTGRTVADWFLIIGTRQGTVHAYLLKDILSSTPIWESIAKHLPSGVWRAARKRVSTDWSGRFEASDDLAQVIEASQDFRVPGQRPFPKDAPLLRLWLRWKCHDYLVERIETTAQHMLTLDMRHDLRLWQLVDMQCVLLCKVGDFQCYAPFARHPVNVTAALSLHQLHRRLSSVPSLGLSDASAGGLGGRSQVFTQPEVSGLILGMASGGIRLMVKDKSGTGTRIATSSALHAAPVLQVDCLEGLCAVVSIAADNTVKIWSETLTHLRDVVFPQPLTAACFLRRQDFDGTRGHGDVLIGFAGAVKVVHLEQWASLKMRSPEENTTEEQTKEYKRSSTSSSTTESGSEGSDTEEDSTSPSQPDLQAYIQRQSSSDDIADYLHALSDADAKEGGPTRCATRLTVVRPTPTRTSPGDSRFESERLAPEQAAGRAGVVVDFRGPPIYEVNTLGNRRPSTSEQRDFSPHSRINVLDQGQVSVVSHFQPVYFDDVISPNEHVTAPREVAIRGTVDRFDTAIVTSIGTGHLRNIYSTGMEAEGAAPDFEGEGLSELPAYEEPDIRELQEELARKASGRRRTKQDRRSEAVLAGLGALEADVRRSSSPLQEGSPSIPDRLDPPLARGVPRPPYPPQEQDSHHTALEVAKQMAARLDVDEVLDLPDYNALRSAVNKKTNFTYAPHNSEVVVRAQARRTQRQQWTNTGRMICGTPPPSANFYVPPLESPRLSRQEPMTRAELTEARIIDEVARNQPPPQLDLSMEVCESVRLKPRNEHQPRSELTAHPASQVEMYCLSSRGTSFDVTRSGFHAAKPTRSGAESARDATPKGAGIAATFSGRAGHRRLIMDAGARVE